jgi:hypothetical protein
MNKKVEKKPTVKKVAVKKPAIKKPAVKKLAIKKGMAKKVATRAVVKRASVKKQSSRSVAKNTNSSSNWFSRIAILLLVVLFGLSVSKLHQTNTQSSDTVISTQVQKLKTIFDQIHQDCGIVDFEHEQNYIDFLTVESFVGSEIGSMNLLYPKEWKGPYVQDNPTVQEQQYIILDNKSGYFIVPGDGVELANGSIVGEDFILDYETDMDQAILRDDELKSDSGVLAVQLDVGQNTLNKMFSH